MNTNKVEFQDILHLINGLKAVKEQHNFTSIPADLIINILQYVILIRVTASNIKMMETNEERADYSKTIHEYKEVLKGIIAEHVCPLTFEDAEHPLLHLQNMVEKYVNECISSAYADTELSAA